MTPLHIPQLSKAAAEAHTFEDFPTSLLSVSKVNNDGNVSIFTKQGVTVHTEEEVLITVKGQPVMIASKINEAGTRYRLSSSKANGSRTFSRSVPREH